MTEHEALARLRQEVEAQGKYIDYSTKFERLVKIRNKYSGDRLDEILETKMIYVYDHFDYYGIGKEFKISLGEFENSWLPDMDFNVYAFDKYRRVSGVKLSLHLPDYSILSSFPHLTWLALEYNELSEINFISSLKELKYIDLSENQIDDITPLSELIQLEEVYLSGNQIADLRPLSNLTQLRTLFLSSNHHVLDLTPFSHLTRITYLDLCYNQIIDITPLSNLINLRRADLRGNQITTLPKKITKIDIEINYIDSFGKQISPLCLDLYQNPIETPPPEILRQGRQAILDWFAAQEDEKLPLNEAKVLLVGDGRVGKTSLVKRLCGEAFDAHEPLTPGIHIQPRTYALNNADLHVRFWDLGGQDIMHHTHQFFFSKRSLYLLVLDAATQARRDYWLHHVRAFGGDSPVIVVLNKIDEVPDFDLSAQERAALQARYPNIQGFYRLSCKTDAGMAAFADNLVNALQHVELVKTSWAKRWFNVKTRIENLTEHFISYDAYLDHCTAEELTDASMQETLLEYLHQLGVIVHFKEFALQDTPVINPAWITEAVYGILTSPELADAHGALPLNRIAPILQRKSQETGLPYPREKYRFIIDLMKRFEVCYTLESEPETMIAPALLPPAPSVFDFDATTALRLQLWYEFLPPSVMARFIVKMCRDIKHDCRWKNAVIVEHSAWRTTALITTDEATRKIQIAVNGAQKRDYLSVIRKTFADIHAGFERLDVDERVCFPDHPENTVSLDDLLWLEQNGERTYTNIELRQKYDVRELLGMVIVEDEYEQRFRRMEKRLKRIDRATQATQQTAAEIKSVLETAFQGVQENIAALKSALQQHTIDEDAFFARLSDAIDDKLVGVTLADFADTQALVIAEFPYLQDFFTKPAPNIEKYRRFLLTAEYLLPRLKHLNLDGAVVMVEYAKIADNILYERISQHLPEIKGVRQPCMLGSWTILCHKKEYHAWINQRYAHDPELAAFLTAQVAKHTEQLTQQRNGAAHSNAYGESEARQIRRMLLEQKGADGLTFMEWLLRIIYDEE